MGGKSWPEHLQRSALPRYAAKSRLGLIQCLSRSFSQHKAEWGATFHLFGYDLLFMILPLRSVLVDLASTACPPEQSPGSRNLGEVSFASRAKPEARINVKRRVQLALLGKCSKFDQRCDCFTIRQLGLRRLLASTEQRLAHKQWLLVSECGLAQSLLGWEWFADP